MKVRAGLVFFAVFLLSTDINAFDASPVKTLEEYRQALDSEEAYQKFDSFTEKTKEFMKNRRVTAAQRRNGARNFDSCMNNEREIFSPNGDYAVVRFPVEERKCQPYLFKLENKNYVLDFYAMNQFIILNHKNQYQLRFEKNSPYLFAFEDWNLDKNGFPFAKLK